VLCSGVSWHFIGVGAVLGIFSYICRQRPIIHWQRWRSRARKHCNTDYVAISVVLYNFWRYKQGL